jgi:hypothetical protein
MGGLKKSAILGFLCGAVMMFTSGSVLAGDISTAFDGNYTGIVVADNGVSHDINLAVRGGSAGTLTEFDTEGIYSPSEIFDVTFNEKGLDFGFVSNAISPACTLVVNLAATVEVNGGRRLDGRFLSTNCKNMTVGGDVLLTLVTN